MKGSNKCAICNKKMKLKNNDLCCEECCYYHETRVQEETEWEQRMYARMYEWEMEEWRAGRI